MNPIELPVRAYSRDGRYLRSWDPCCGSDYRRPPARREGAVGGCVPREATVAAVQGWTAKLTSRRLAPEHIASAGDGSPDTQVRLSEQHRQIDRQLAKRL